MNNQDSHSHCGTEREQVTRQRWLIGCPSTAPAALMNYVPFGLRRMKAVTWRDLSQRDPDLLGHL
jgi:hypothetical protein